MVDLLEKVKHFIEEENCNALEVIYNAELAKLGKCAIISKKILLAKDLSLPATFQWMMHAFALWVIKES